MKKCLIVFVCLGLGASVFSCGSSDDGDDGFGYQSCAELMAGYSGCGGDLLGTWQISMACIDDSALENPMATDCPDSTLVFSLDWAGSLEFTETAMIGTFTKQAFQVEFTVPVSCLNSGTCADLQTQIGDGTTCSTADPCVCQQTDDEASGQPTSDDYTLNGNTLTFPNAVDGPDSIEFCIKGNQMAAKATAPDGEGGTTTFFILMDKI